MFITHNKKEKIQTQFKIIIAQDTDLDCQEGLPQWGNQTHDLMFPVTARWSEYPLYMVRKFQHFAPVSVPAHFLHLSTNHFSTVALASNECMSLWQKSYSGLLRSRKSTPRYTVVLPMHKIPCTVINRTSLNFYFWTGLLNTLVWIWYGPRPETK